MYGQKVLVSRTLLVVHNAEQYFILHVEVDGFIFLSGDCSLNTTTK